MRQRVTIILTILVVVGLLVIINTFTYVKDENPLDSELTPKRSTYHAGPTGSRALYDFLNESGYHVMRWREPSQKLLDVSGQKIQTLVVVGPTQLPFTNEDGELILQWVQRGGRLVLIDRWPPTLLLPQTGDWKVTLTGYSFPNGDVDPGDPKEMTESVQALQPTQPTLLTAGVQSLMPSRYASRIEFVATLPGAVEIRAGDTDRFSPAPVSHIADDKGSVLVDYSYGNGRIVLLSDAYPVSNGGINLNDNLQVAINVLTSTGGLIAFDEYHQGRGLTANPFASYFAGTPVLAIAAQLVVLTLVILWTKARRFARPLPLVQIDRRSSLEFVASMSELQERSRAFDLAIENIYSRTRRVLARHAGVDYNSPRSLIASRVAIRSALDANQLETLMRQCEEAINGGQIGWRQSIELVRRLREVERTLGLRMRSRDERQAVANI